MSSGDSIPMLEIWISSAFALVLVSKGSSTVSNSKSCTSSSTSKTLILGSNNVSKIPCFKFINYGNSKEDIAHNIFHLLREADKYEPDLIIIASPNPSFVVASIKIMSAFSLSACLNKLKMLWDILTKSLP